MTCECVQEEVVGPIDNRHTYLDMASGIHVPPGLKPRAETDGQQQQQQQEKGEQQEEEGVWWSSGPGTTCPAAMGWSFAAGTTDGALCS